MIISRSIYQAAITIGEGTTRYDPKNQQHADALEAGVARIQGDLIELTHKGEEVIRLED